MDLKKIKAFIELAKEQGVSELKYESGHDKISVTLPVMGGTGVVPVVAPIAGIPAAAPAAAAAATPAAAPSNFHEIRSPFVGTYYCQPAPGEPSFVKVGDRVSKGQTLCILEAMKIMNEIDSDVNGEVVEICVENENLVEFGQVLFRIKV